jgi:hypothetical protein
MTTEKAFEMVGENAYLWQLTGESKAKRRWYKTRLKQGKLISYEMKEKLLKQVGFTIVVERQWAHLDVSE